LIKKNRDIVNTKNFQNAIGYYLLFNFLVFLTSLFSILPVYGFQKILKVFVLIYCMDPRFYHKILQNYGFLLKRNWDIWKPEFQQNSVVYYLFFIFLLFVTFFFYYTHPNLSKNYGIFCSILFEGIEILSTNSGNL